MKMVKNNKLYLPTKLRMDAELSNLIGKALDKLNGQQDLQVTRPTLFRLALKNFCNKVLAGEINIGLAID